MEALLFPDLEQIGASATITLETFWLKRIKVKLLSKLGRGSFGDVYMADVVGVREGVQDVAVGDKVAVKRIERESAGEDEIRLYTQFNEDPKAVQICSVASCLIDSRRRSDGAYYLAFELLDYAKDLFQVIQTVNKVPRNDATRLIRMKLVKEVSVTVGLLHALGIFHRDLKPSNLVMGELLHHDTTPMLETWNRVGTLDVDPEIGPDDTNLERYVKLRNASVGIDPVAETTFVEVFVVDPLLVKIIDLGFGIRTCFSTYEKRVVGTAIFVDPWYVRAIVKARDILGFARMDLIYPMPKRMQHCDYANFVWQSNDKWSLGMTLYHIFHGFAAYADMRRTDKDVYQYSIGHLISGLEPLPLPRVIAVLTDTRRFLADFEKTMVYLCELGDYPRRGALHVDSLYLAAAALDKPPADLQLPSSKTLAVLEDDALIIEPLAGLLEIYPLDRVENVLEFGVGLEIDVDKLP